MYMLMQKYTVNISSIGETKVYVGSDIRKLEYFDGSYACTMSSDSYVKEYIRNVKECMKDDRMEFNKNLSDINYSLNNPHSAAEYRPELDTSAECTKYQFKFFHNLIRLMRWILELGRIYFVL